MHIPEEQASSIIRAVEHYAAYLRATNRDDRPYLILAESQAQASGPTAIGSRQQTTSQAAAYRAIKEVTRSWMRGRQRGPSWLLLEQTLNQAQETIEPCALVCPAQKIPQGL